MRYSVRPRAWLDIEETMIYLRDEAGDEIAGRFWREAQETFILLAQQPFLGRPRSDLKPDEMRERI